MYGCNSPLKRCILILSLFQAVVIGTSDVDARLGPRQTSTTTATAVTCLDYASIANLSTIGLNATYRAAYLQAAPDGTQHSANLLNDAEAKLPPLTKNVALNEQCGNLTTIALTEAANNFTRGIVAQYRVSAGIRNQGVLGSVIIAFCVTLGAIMGLL
jgi:hypothetical protein